MGGYTSNGWKAGTDWENLLLPLLFINKRSKGGKTMDKQEELQELQEQQEQQEEQDYVSRETYDKLEQKSKELEKKIKKLEQTILHANVEQKDENPFKEFSRYD